MKKLLFLLFLGLAAGAFAQGNWVVQVGAFDQKMSLSYFTGLSGVYEVRDHNQIHRYYIGGMKTQAEALTAAANAVKAGFNARPVNLEEMEQQCSASCRDENTGWIYFDYDLDGLRPASKQKLELLADILKKNPGFKATLTGHTDAHGSDEYNQGLAKRRVENAKIYLVALGIAANRLTVNYLGEARPIAKNEVNGQDTPAGRQFNRRVELTIFDEKGVEKTQMMQGANVPAYLKN